MKKIYIHLLIFMIFTFFNNGLKAQLKADFTLYADSGCTQFADSFTNTTSGGTKPYTFLWDLGNGINDTSTNSYALYTKQGTFHITLFVTDVKGNKDSVTKTINVLGSPIADYSSKLTTCSTVIYNANEDSLTPTSIIDYLIIGQGPPGYPPLHIHDQTGIWNFDSHSGTFRYSLIVTGANGCKVIYNDSIKIPTMPTINLPNDTSVCLNTNLKIQANIQGGTPPYLTWWWSQSLNIYGDSISQNISKDTEMVVYVNDARDCYSYDSMKVHALPLPNPHWTLKNKLDSVKLEAREIGFQDSSYIWYILTDHNLKLNKRYGPVFNRVFSADTIYDITLILTGSNGCTAYFDSTVNGAQLGIKPDIAKDFQPGVYPNPFRESTLIQYHLNHLTYVEIGVYDISGKKIAEITNEMQQPGLKQFDFDAQKYHLDAGVYILKITTDEGETNIHIVKL